MHGAILGKHQSQLAISQCEGSMLNVENTRNSRLFRVLCFLEFHDFSRMHQCILK